MQAWHIPQADEAQQTPSTQLSPLRQLLVPFMIVQGCPWRWRLPQWFVFGSQMVGDRQSASDLQVALQLVVPLHRYGAQLVVVAA